MKLQHFGILPILLLTISCGGGGNHGSDILNNGLLGKKTGLVGLTENGCAVYRDIPVTEISFTHDISAQVVGNERLNITFDDNNYVCNALNFDRYGGRFDGNCGIQPLGNFISGYDCEQELVWSYSEPTSDVPNSTADVVRTAYVRCYQNDQIQFVCPVTYQGVAFDCTSGSC